MAHGFKILYGFTLKRNHFGTISGYLNQLSLDFATITNVLGQSIYLSFEYTTKTIPRSWSANTWVCVANSGFWPKSKLLPLSRFGSSPFLWPGETTIFALWDDSEILWSIICGISILMIDIFAVTFTNSTRFCHLRPCRISLSPSFLLRRLSVVRLVLEFVVSRRWHTFYIRSSRHEYQSNVIQPYTERIRFVLVLHN